MQYKTLFLFFFFVNFLSYAEIKPPTFPIDTTQSVKIKELTVTEHYHKNQKNTVSTQLLSSKDLKISPFLQLSDALKTFSGLNIKDYGGVGGLKTVSVRSLGANHTAVNYDGLTVSDINTGQIDLSKFSVENLEVLSLYQGQAEFSLQPARNFASASVINLQTKRPSFKMDEKINGTVQTKFGSFGLLNPSLFLNVRNSDLWTSNYQLEYLYSKGNYPYKMVYGINQNDSSSSEIRKNGDISQFKFETNWFGILKDQSRLNIKANLQHVNRGLPGATVFYASQDFARQRLVEWNAFTQGSLRKDYHEKFQSLFSWKISNSQMNYQDPDFLNSEGGLVQHYSQNEFYGSGALNYDAFKNLSFSISSDAFLNTMMAYSENAVNPVRFTSLNYLSAKYRLEKLRINSGLLYTFIRESSSNMKTFNKLSPFIGFNYTPYERISFRTFYKETFRMPTFSDMYYPLMGNPKLNPEKAKLFNFGSTFHYEHGNLNILWNADIYWNRVDDKIVAFPNKSIYTWTILNFGRTDNKGLDFNGEISFQIQDNMKLSCGLGGSYQRALDITDSDGETYLHQLPYTPRISGSGNLSFQYKDFILSSFLVWSGHRYVLPQNFSPNRLNAYSDIQISALKSFKIKNYKLDFKTELLNVLNRTYSIVRWFPMPGRNYRVCLSLYF